MSIMKIYAFGSNGSGQLGIGHKNDVSTPQECLFSTDDMSRDYGNPVGVAAGGNTTLTLFDTGLLFSAGSYVVDTDTEACSSLFTRTVLRQCSRERKVKLCSLTWEASMIVTNSDEVWVCGIGNKGELGLGIDVNSASVIHGRRKLHDFPPAGLGIVDLAGSVSHTVAVLSDGTAYGWGSGRKGELGEPAEVVWAPRKIEGLNFDVVRAACGSNFTLLVGHTKLGIFAVLGPDKWRIKSQAPSHVNNWKDIGASWGSIFVLDSLGQIQSWGRNDHGQLAPPGLPPISNFAIGSEHVVALTETGHIKCWGWGEHGNCGPDIDANGDVEGRWSDIEFQDLGQSMKCVGVGAGCATSFLWSTSET